jgi:hypothetical protein
MHTVEYIEETPGTVRIRRCGLLRSNTDHVDQLCIKVADTRNELEQAFALVYREYLRQGYIKDFKQSGLHLNIHHILPETAVFILKSAKVISTLTHITDTELFGLPMDSLYQEELKPLRDAGRKLVELSSLATSREACGRNLFLYLFREVYWYALRRNIQDFCIMVNPKHARFYNEIFFFQEIGPEKHYSRVGAPAVALRLNLEDFDLKLERAYSGLEPQCNMYAFFHSVGGPEMPKGLTSQYFRSIPPLSTETVRYFFEEKTNVLAKTSVDQIRHIRSLYPGLHQQVSTA